jgi:signal peptidase I
MKKLFKVIYYLFFVAVILVIVLLLLSTLPVPGKLKFFVVQSGSMEPTIHTGSVVVIKQEQDYNVGDIITFGPNTRISSPTTHRIFEKKDSGGVISYVTKGDANNGPDIKNVSQGEVIGKLVFKVPIVGYIVAAIKKPYGFLAIVIIPALIIIFDEIRKIIKEVNKKNRAKKNSKMEKGDSSTEEIQ